MAENAIFAKVTAHSGLSRPQGHEAYGPLHRAVANQVQEFLPGL